MVSSRPCGIFDTVFTNVSYLKKMTQLARRQFAGPHKLTIFSSIWFKKRRSKLPLIMILPQRTHKTSSGSFNYLYRGCLHSSSCIETNCSHFKQQKISIFVVNASKNYSSMDMNHFVCYACTKTWEAKC